MAACDGCKRSGGDEESLKKPVVKVATVAEVRIAPHTTVAGVLAPLPGKDVKVGALVPGRVNRVFVAEGDAVKSGQALAHVEAEPLQAERVAGAGAARARVRRAAECQAPSSSARSGSIATASPPSRRSTTRAPPSSPPRAGSSRRRRPAASPASSSSARPCARPSIGVVAAILVPAGQPVDGNGTPVIEVADTKVLDLRAPVSAARVGDVSVGQRAELDVEGVGTVAGAVEAIAPLVDPTTNTVVVRIRVPNDEGRLRGGMFARGAILGAPHPGLAVPRAALLPGDGGAATNVAVVDGEGVVSHRALSLGAEAGDVVEVRGGLKAGERVIVAGGYALPDGTKVEITP